MTDTQQQDTDRTTEPFVRQITWLIDHAGGKDALVRATGNRISSRTLDNWIRGDYPRSAVTGAVRELDAWALAQDVGYPAAAGAPRLVDSCGPAAVRDKLPVHLPRPAPPPAADSSWWLRRPRWCSSPQPPPWG